jgi:hypothetical protein
VAFPLAGCGSQAAPDAAHNHGFEGHNDSFGSDASRPTVAVQAVIGSGVLYLPFFFAILGWVGGIIMTLLFGAITWCAAAWPMLRSSCLPALAALSC